MLQRLRMCRLPRRHSALLGPSHPGPALPQLSASGACPYSTRRYVEARRRQARGFLPARVAAAPFAPSPNADPSEPSTSTPSTIYSRPELYDIAFSYRDFKAEVKFLQDVYKQHGGGPPLASILELGCGPARHLAGLARAGVSRVVGLDLSPDMLQHARASLAKQGGKAQGVELLQGDMAAFDLPYKSFDLGTFSHMLDTQHAISCFRAAAAHLRPGGLLVLEMAHPGDLFDGTLIIGESGKEVWEVPYNGDKVFVEWGAEYDNFDPVTQIIFRTVTINVLRGDNVVDSVEEVVPYRQFTVRELELLAGMTGFETSALYGEMRLGVDLEHEDAYRMVAVYHKATAPAA
ncbi:dTDP-3-amino-3,4,6-trideoxy-alpha-D-glucopyranose [Tetrabaena socialis]|uniref:dTDP-3-amino-3,4, 6-trideoxy-alpha-D-glucopyranose n=1 Tax=Tetrabaena socialis TaxID=47790 RepID=A0A2J8A7K0_9CHLO|nr:dTDP-3-amino-3,4,6-trideoxy-alpha-D-glucopyranose [Tetrabaena socialis]|eukprot:PNH08460.1 dTDP-3-amino-3,4,6-trideoxy-alpha-D-glucopyranose [Tetrabaena socialis]